MTTINHPTTPQTTMIDDQISAVQIGKGEVRGRVLRLGTALDEVLGGDRYPDAVAMLLGEAVMKIGRAHV